MRGPIFFGMALAISLAVAPRGARACGRGGGYGNGYGALIATVLAVGAVDVGLSLWNGGSALASHQPSVGYGVFELLISTPQLALGSYGLYTQLSSPYNRNGIEYTALYTVWMGLLTTHAIWTIASSSTAPEPSEQAARQRIDPPPKTAVLALAPTYVALGQRSQPGFGLVGRF
jgi:hypothetical protein